MKTIREVIEALDDEIRHTENNYGQRGYNATLHIIACLRRARQIVKASEKTSKLHPGWAGKGTGWRITKASQCRSAKKGKR